MMMKALVLMLYLRLRLTILRNRHLRLMILRNLRLHLMILRNRCLHLMIPRNRRNDCMIWGSCFSCTPHTSRCSTQPLPMIHNCFFCRRILQRRRRLEVVSSSVLVLDAASELPLG